MKKLTVMLLVMTLVFGLAACGNASEKGSNVTETHGCDDTTDGRTVLVFGCPVCAFGTAPAGSVGKPHFRGKHCRNVCGAQKTPDHTGHYHDRPDLGFHCPYKRCQKSTWNSSG